MTVRHYIKIFDKLILCSINTSISVCSCHTGKNDLTFEKKKKGKQKATGIKRVYTHNNILVFDGNQKGNYSEKINRKNRPGGFCGFVGRCNMKEGLLKEIAAHGDRGAIVPISRFDELKSEIEALKTDKHNMFINWMAKYMTIPDGLDFQPRSLISVITPSPKIMFGFTYHGKLIHFMVPPQYLDMDLRDNEVLQYITAYLEPYGHRAAILKSFHKNCWLYIAALVNMDGIIFVTTKNTAAISEYFRISLTSPVTKLTGFLSGVWMHAKTAVPV